MIEDIKELDSAIYGLKLSIDYINESLNFMIQLIDSIEYDLEYGELKNIHADIKKYITDYLELFTEEIDKIGRYTK